jgi:hypothetical protein
MVLPPFQSYGSMLGISLMNTEGFIEITDTAVCGKRHAAHAALLAAELTC